MNPMIEKFTTLWPEICLLVGAVVCLFTGLAPSDGVRRATVWVAAAALVFAGLLIPDFDSLEHGVFAIVGMPAFIKMAVVIVGLILLLVAAGVPGHLMQTHDAETAAKWEPGNCMRGEFFAFFLLSLTGVMMTAGADDLVWLFLALELTSLPTYVMVATARDKIDAQESAVKYFFLGAMSAAIFLYGFALIYGATGYTTFSEIQAYVASQEQMPGLFTIGLVLSIVGICFKIAAVPMHFYAADVYEGAATPVTAFLAFVPKTAGFVALILMLNLVGWPLPPVLAGLIWWIAALTMTFGNVLGLLQKSVKRTLAYSSVAHSGYILLGLLAGFGSTDTTGGDGLAIGDGLAAVMFYLVAYGVGTIGSFAVLACLRARGEEVDSFADLSGLAKRHPMLSATMVMSLMSLLGMPPLVGFLGKVYLFGSAIEAGFLGLVIVAVINSAISAGYYLRISAACVFGDPAEGVEVVPGSALRTGAVLAGAAVLFFGIAGGILVQTTRDATLESRAEHRSTETGSTALEAVAHSEQR